MEDLMKLFERFNDTYNEIKSDFNTVADREEYVDIITRSSKGERFICRNYLSDWYSKLTKEQKELIAEFEVLLGAACLEDKHDMEYNLKNYDMLNDKNFLMKGGIIIGS